MLHLGTGNENKSFNPPDRCSSCMIKLVTKRIKNGIKTVTIIDVSICMIIFPRIGISFRNKSFLCLNSVTIKSNAGTKKEAKRVNQKSKSSFQLVELVFDT